MGKPMVSWLPCIDSAALEALLPKMGGVAGDLAIASAGCESSLVATAGGDRKGSAKGSL